MNNSAVRKRYEAAPQYQTNYDALTGLANRHQLQDRLSQKQGLRQNISFLS